MWIVEGSGVHRVLSGFRVIFVGGLVLQKSEGAKVSALPRASSLKASKP